MVLIWVLERKMNSGAREQLYFYTIIILPRWSSLSIWNGPSGTVLGHFIYNWGRSTSLLLTSFSFIRLYYITLLGPGAIPLLSGAVVRLFYTTGFIP